MDQIIALKVPFRFGNVEDIIYPAVLLDDREMVLVDCGYTGFLPQMEKAFGDQGLNCGNLAKIVVTHHDHDHMGALADFKEKYPQIQVLAGCGEVPYIEGLKKALRLEQAERMQAGLPDDQKEFGKAFCEVLKRVKPAFVDSAVHGGDSFGWCRGCEIIDTPGHTPGHIALYLKQWKTVITGMPRQCKMAGWLLPIPSMRITWGRHKNPWKSCFPLTQIPTCVTMADFIGKEKRSNFSKK